MSRFLQHYFKHAALNLGQAMQGLRYLGSHPDIDRIAPRGTWRHLRLSVPLRCARIVYDLFFAMIPPQWHHTPEELDAMLPFPARQWFAYGYCAWRFTDTGARKTSLDGVDRRWDPRCL